MFKKIFLVFVSLIILLNFISSSETGIKFSVNTRLLEVIKKVDFSQKFTNLTLIGQEGVTYEKDSFPSVALHVSNLTIAEFSNPKNIEVITDNAQKSMEILFKSMNANLKVSYGLKVMSILKDSGKNSVIQIVFDDFSLGIQFTDDKILVKHLNFKISKVDFSLNQFILNFILKMFKSTIIGKINQSVENFRVLFEQKLNSAFSSELLIDLAGMGIGVNATMTNRPDMNFFNSRTLKKIENASIMKIFVDLVSEILTDENKKFLNSEETPSIRQPPKFSTDSNIESFISGGIRGAIFATIMKELKPKIPEPVDMEFTERYKNNKILVLISDYTINTLLFFIQQSGYVNFRIQNDTNQYLPFNSDIEGFKQFFPKLTEKYAENFPVEIKINCETSGQQPLINTDTDGSKVSFNLGFELKVYNSTDIFDDPITELSLDFNATLQIQYMIDDNYLYIIVFGTNVEDVNVRTDNLETSKDQLIRNIETFMDYIVDKFRPSFAKINVEEMLNNAFGYKFDSFEFDSRKGFIEVSVDIPEI